MKNLLFQDFENSMINEQVEEIDVQIDEIDEQIEELDDDLNESVVGTAALIALLVVLVKVLRRKNRIRKLINKEEDPYKKRKLRDAMKKESMAELKIRKQIKKAKKKKAGTKDTFKGQEKVKKLQNQINSLKKEKEYIGKKRTARKLKRKKKVDSVVNKFKK